MKSKIIAQKAVLEKDGKLLILHRAENENAFPGLWDFPGGKLEGRENKEESLIREVKEETQLIIKPQKMLGIYHAILKDKPVEFIIYTANMLDGDVSIGEEHSQFCWATPAEIKLLKTMPYMIECLENYNTTK